MSLLQAPDNVEELHPADVLRWAFDTYGVGHVAVTSSFEDAVLAHLAVAGHGGQCEGAVGRVVGGVHPDAAVRCVDRHSCVHGRFVGGRDDQTNVIQVTRLVRSVDDSHCQSPNAIDDVWGHHGHLRTCSEQAFDLSLGHAPTTYDQHRNAGQVEHDRVVERHQERLQRRITPILIEFVVIR